LFKYNPILLKHNLFYYLFLSKAVNIPIVVLGGIMNATDAIEFLLAGATAIQVGTANFIDPSISEKIVTGIDEYLNRHGFKSVYEIIGGLNEK